MGRTIAMLALLAACTSPAERLEAQLSEQRAKEEAIMVRLRHEEQQRVASAQVSDRSGMSYDELRDHLAQCRRMAAMPGDYTSAVLDDVVAKSPWPEAERQVVREGKIRVGFTEEQVRVAWGEPSNERRTLYEFGEVKYLRYGRSTVHVKNGRVEIIGQ